MKKNFISAVAILCLILGNVASLQADTLFDRAALDTLNSQLNLSFTNDPTLPWTVETGFVKSGNVNQGSYTTSDFSTTVTLDKPYELSFSWRINNPYADTLRFYLNEVEYRYTYNASSEENIHLTLEAGTHTLRWSDHRKGYSSSSYYACIKGICLQSADYTEVSLSSTGTLGLAVLNKVTNLSDVVRLKVTGPLNADDFGNIKSMTALRALDLSGALFSELPANQFYNFNPELEILLLPEGLKTIGNGAIRAKMHLYQLTLPSTVETVGEYAFYNCSWFRSCLLSSQLKKLASQAFGYCYRLQEINLPNTIREWGTNTFTNCTGLRNIQLPATIGLVPDNTFSQCYSLRSVTLPEGISTIGYQAFYNCKQLSRLVLPNSLRSIGESAFNGCNSLVKLSLPAGIRSLYNYAFSTCSIDSLVIPSSCTLMGYQCFCDNKALSYVELPEAVDIYQYTFYNCTNLKKVVCRAILPPAPYQYYSTSYYPFHNVDLGNVELQVPAVAVAAYKLDSYWCTFKSITEFNQPISSVYFSSDLTLPDNVRLGTTPMDITQYHRTAFTFSGSAPFEMKDYVLYEARGDYQASRTDASNNNSSYYYLPASLISQSSQTTAQTVEIRYQIWANRWHFITLPFEVALGQISCSDPSAGFVFRYYDSANRAENGSGSSWKNVAEGDTLHAGKGYILHCNTSCLFTFPATEASRNDLFCATSRATRLEEHNAVSIENQSWNFVGNLYPCYYDSRQLDYTAPITVWDYSNNTYKAYSLVDDAYILSPMQAFFVQKPADIDSLRFQPQGRQATATAAVLGEAPARKVSLLTRELINLTLMGDQTADQTRVVVNAASETLYELDKDASKFFSPESAVQLYSLSDDGSIRYAINERPFTEGSIRLGFMAIQAGRYTLTNNGKEVLLYDRVQEKTVTLNKQGYTFSTESGTFEQRFELRLTGATLVEETSPSELQIKHLPGGIELTGMSNDAVEIYHSTGRLVQALTLSGHQEVALPQGTYLLRHNGSTQKIQVY